MTKKVLKEQQQETREIVKQIFALALAINPNDTKQDTTGNKPTVFVNFGGHIAGVEVEIYHDGWDSEKECSQTRYMIYLGDEMFTKSVDEYKPLSKAKAALAELKRIAEEWGVDYV